ncbi:MAG: hypothetical protein QNJ97_11115 [Myxococcota bacterium]|nr:hypothetical protein [Myxococcota bacterium]
MSDNGMTRRGAMNKLMQLVAAAAGISVADLDALLAAEAKKGKKPLKKPSAPKSKPAVSKSAISAGDALDALKVKLSGYSGKVFESVYGKTTPIRSMSEMQLPRDVTPGGPGSMGCVVNFGGGIGGGATGAAACPALEFCGSFGGSACPSLDTCGDNVCSGQDYGGESGGCMGVNDCNDQDCTELEVCGDNECTEQNCPSLNGCGKNKQGLVSILDQFKTDPYVQDLLRHFNVATSTKLAPKLELMIRRRRALTPTQLQQTRPGLKPTRPKP